MTSRTGWICGVGGRGEVSRRSGYWQVLRSCCCAATNDVDVDHNDDDDDVTR